MRFYAGSGLVALSAIASVTTLASSAHAQYVSAYSTFGSYTGQYLAQTPGLTVTNNGITQTALYADDFVVAPGFAGQTITQVSFALVNPTANSFSARLRYRVYDTTSPSPVGGPGVYQQLGYSPVLTLTPGLNEITYNAGGILTTPIPASGAGWFGLFFDNGNGATATASDIASIGFALYGTPTVGTTTNRFFVSSDASGGTGGAYLSANPSGTINSGSPTPVKFGLVLQASAAPEPGTLAFVFPFGVTAGVICAQRRRKV